MSRYVRTGIIPKPVWWLGDSRKAVKAFSATAVHAENAYRLIYVAKFEDAVYVLHAFTKKTRETSLQDVRLAQRRYREMIVRRGMG